MSPIINQIIGKNNTLEHHSRKRLPPEPLILLFSCLGIKILTNVTGALKGLHEIADNYDVILCDIWGVLHNGVARHPEADVALRKFKGRDKKNIPRVALVTNMPRPLADVVAMLESLGIGDDAYDAISSSGDVARAEILRYAGKNIRHVGPSRLESLFAGIDVKLGDAQSAVAIIVSDVDSDIFAAGGYDAEMEIWLARKLPMICANPDKVVEVGNTLRYCAGALADIYEARGGEVVMAGKPFAPIYEYALKKLEALSVPRARILSIGDAVRTDAAGAALQKVDFLFISGSVHAGELATAGGANDANIEALIAPTGARLAGHMPMLVW